jgi:hypothetical protein
VVLHEGNLCRNNVLFCEWFSMWGTYAEMMCYSVSGSP